MSLLPYYSNQSKVTEAGVDEAGRGCLAGPVFAAAVILGNEMDADLASQLNDSKNLTERHRQLLRKIIEQTALSWAVGIADNIEIDQINILNASYLAMHRAIDKLTIKPELLLVDGNRFKPYNDIKHKTIIKGDGLYCSIAAASILAKTHRDEFMLRQHNIFPWYGWDKNMGYPTDLHRKAIMAHGQSPLHRKSFNSGAQLKLDFD